MSQYTVNLDERREKGLSLIAKRRSATIRGPIEERTVEKTPDGDVEHIIRRPAPPMTNALALEQLINEQLEAAAQEAEREVTNETARAIESLDPEKRAAIDKIIRETTSAIEETVTDGISSN
jgi:hypothetical protein